MAKIGVPSPGNLYHGVFPAGEIATANECDLDAYEGAVKKKVAWVAFDHEWKDSPAFPSDVSTWIGKRCAVPYLRLNLRSTTDKFVAECKYTLKAIIQGCFKNQLYDWGRAAKDQPPFICEWGTEANGMWNPWNAVHNGGPAGGQLFKDAYKTIIDTIRTAGANDITWVFHVNHENKPDVNWNRPEYYDPGRGYADWLGISIYGAQSADETGVYDFVGDMQSIYNCLQKIRDCRPIVISEFGYSLDATGELHAANWADAALSNLLAGERWPEVCGFSWWNETWANGSKPTNMRVQQNRQLAAQFRARFDQYKARILDHPLR